MFGKFIHRQSNVSSGQSKALGSRVALLETFRCKSELRRFPPKRFMNVCIYPGTFDPITHGHLDVLERACRIFERVIIAIAENQDKHPFFSAEKRLQLVNENLDRFPTAKAMTFKGLLIDFAKEQEASVIIRGLRAVSDFEFEFQMANMNRHLGPGIETVLVMTKEGYNYTSSTLVKQVAEYGADVNKFVPDNVYQALQERLASR